MGLPLGIVLAEAGFVIDLVDISTDKVAQVNAGHMPFLEDDAERRLPEALKTNRLKATVDTKAVAAATAVIVIIGTPVDEYLNPRVQDITKAISQILPHLHSEQTVILRSTVFPGTSERVRDLLHEKGVAASVGFAPERIAQGRALHELRALPQIISAFDQRGLTVQREIFGALTEGRIIELRPIEAELAKLFSNAYRYLNFAISNQFFVITQKAGADFSAIHRAITHEYPRMSAFARAGFAAGPCLFKDTMQLSAFSQNTFFLGHAAMLINEGMPAVVIEMLEARLGRPVRGESVGILSMTFKKDSDDTRDSLAFKLRRLLEAKGADVVCHDPFLNLEAFPNLRLTSLEIVQTQPSIIIGAPHSVYQELAFSPQQVVIDIWR